MDMATIKFIVEKPMKQAIQAPMLNVRNLRMSIAAGAGDITELSDVIVPSIFVPYAQNYTIEKSRLIQSGALTISERLNAMLAGEGTTFTARFYRDLDREDEENTSSASDPTDSTPSNIESGREIQVRMSRNKSWGSADLLDSLVSPDPLDAISRLVGGYRAGRLQRQFVATVKGMFAMNDADPVKSGDKASTHTKGDMTHNISGSTFNDGVTNFSPAAVIMTAGTMGDSLDQLSMMMVHSVVYLRMQLLNLIDYIPDSEGRISIPTYMGREVIVDDSMPSNAGVYETWLVGAGAFQLGTGSPKVAAEVERMPASYKGGGSEVLYHRWENIIHPVGHAWVGTAAEGGPQNSALQTATNWARVFPERKQIKIARLVTREHA